MVLHIIDKHLKDEKNRDKLLSLHLFISCRQNSQDLMIFGVPKRKLPKTVIKIQVNSYEIPGEQL